MKQFASHLLLAAMLFSATLATGQAQELRDPTQPSYYDAGDNAYLDRLKQSFRLHSVLVSSERRVAVINGKRVQEGDRIDEARVQKISGSSVRLNLAGAAFDIYLAGGQIKQLK